MTKICIIGAGSWGTALGVVLARSRPAHRVTLWAHSADVLAALRSGGENPIYLPGVRIPKNIEITNDMREALAGADLLVGAMPSAHARTVYKSMLPYLEAQHASQLIFVSATKGLDDHSLSRMTEVVREIIGTTIPVRVAALSGPSFAAEVARGDPTAVVIASDDLQAAACVQREFSGPTLRLYTNDDVIGTELGGAVKNVIAIAAGICTGFGLGMNSVAALVTRGLAEMTRLAIALGGRRDTLAGLAGLGDLVLTATGTLSRNRAVGIELGKGRPLAEILSGMRMVAEGVGTTAATVALARRHSVEMPITQQMHLVLDQGREPREAIRELMERELTHE